MVVFTRNILVRRCYEHDFESKAEKEENLERCPECGN